MGQERIVSLQILRFVAAMMVVFAHSAFLAEAVTGHAGVLAPGYAAQVGTAGVDIFFVISGFVIALTGLFARPQPSGAKFFWRRWSRVAPMFYLVTLFSLPIIMADSPLKSLGGGRGSGRRRPSPRCFSGPAPGARLSPTSSLAGRCVSRWRSIPRWR
ncbi:MAG TPA: acyltransferase family protein [Caulobacteraceae bacterium]